MPAHRLNWKPAPLGRLSGVVLVLVLALPGVIGRAAADPSDGEGDGKRGGFFVVQGVAGGDTLSVRVDADPRSPVVGDIPAGARGVLATGQTRQVGPSVWREIVYVRTRGWVNGRFLAASPASWAAGPPPTPAPARAGRTPRGIGRAGVGAGR